MNKNTIRNVVLYAGGALFTYIGIQWISEFGKYFFNLNGTTPLLYTLFRVLYPVYLFVYAIGFLTKNRNIILAGSVLNIVYFAIHVFMELSILKTGGDYETGLLKMSIIKSS